MMDEEAIPKWHLPTFTVVTLSNSFPLGYESNECPTERVVFCFSSPFYMHACIFLRIESKRVCHQNNCKLRTVTNSEHPPEAWPGTANKGPACPLFESLTSDDGTRTSPFHWDPSTFLIVLHSPSGGIVLLACFTNREVAAESSETMCWRTDSRDAPGICPNRWTGLGTDVSNFFKSRTCCPIFFSSGKHTFSFCHCSPKYYI